MKWMMSLLRSLPGWTSSMPARMAYAFIFLLMIIALLGPIIANEKPYYCQLDGKKYYPLFTGLTEVELSNAHPGYSPVDWQKTKFDRVWRAPIPYSYHTIDLEAGTYISPFASQIATGRFRHWLGTDALGRDVLAGMIRGCRVSLLIGFGSMLLALLIGVPFGAIAAWWGNKQLRMNIGQLMFALFLLIVIGLIWFMPIPTIYIVLLTLCILLLIVVIISRWRGDRVGRIALPVDRMVMGVISIIDGFPAIFLILVLVAVLPVKGWVVIMGIIALLRWPAMARYMRAEVFKMKEANYIKAAQILNIPSLHILGKQIIPYALRPVMISFIFGVSSAILAESSLSFLGIGLPSDEINWGRLLAQSRNHFAAWWLVVFPGCAIFFTLLSLYTIGNSYQSKIVE